jgi:hypothetical protein
MAALFWRIPQGNLEPWAWRLKPSVDPSRNKKFALVNYHSKDVGAGIF